MKKQALLLIALVSCANVSAFTMPTLSMPAMPQVFVQAANNPKQTAILAIFAAVWTVIAYKLLTEGIQGSSTPKVKEEKSDYHVYGTSFPTMEQKYGKELYKPVTTIETQEVAPVTTQDQSALDKDNAYWTEFSERQMEILS